MNLENETLFSITDSEGVYLAKLKDEAERLRAANKIDLDNFTIRFIKDDARYRDELKAKQNREDEDNIESSDSEQETIIDFDESIKEEFARAWRLNDEIKAKSDVLVQLSDIVENRREEMSEFKEQLEKAKKKYPYLELNGKFLKKQKSFVNWDIDGNTGDVTIVGQLERNTKITGCFLDTRLKFGNVCMKILAILILGNDMDFSEGFVKSMKSYYNDYLKSESTCSIAKTAEILDKIRDIMYDQETNIGLKLIQWILNETKIGSFMPYEEIETYVGSLRKYSQKVDMEEILVFIVENSFQNFTLQFMRLFEDYRDLLLRIKSEISFKLKPRELRVRRQDISHTMNLLDVHKRLTNVFNAKDGSVVSMTDFGSSYVADRHGSRLIRSPIQTTKKSTKLLYKITSGAGVATNRHGKLKHSRSRELSTSATVKSTNQDKNDGAAANLSSHGFLVLLSQYHQSIRGCRLGLS